MGVPDKGYSGLLLPLFYCRISAAFPLKNGVLFSQKSCFNWVSSFALSQKKNQLTVFVLPLSALFF
jgi:hypothetical protein